MCNKSFEFFSLIIFCLLGIGVFGHPLSDIYDVCERYTQCKTIATLDERLCLGNTRSMPFWLPPSTLKNDEMSEHCHKSLKPYYKQLERLESEESQQLLACLMEQAVPINSEQRLQCSQNLKRAPKYNFNGEDLMDRIPTNCFQGIQRRLEKQCGALRDCCSSVENCSNFENSEITTKIKKLKDFIKDYGKQCQLGLTTDDLFFNEDGDLEEKKPNGNIIVRFNTEEKPKQYSPKIDTNNQQRLLVRVFTAAEEIERLRESGDDVEADKLQKELENVEGMFKGTSAKMTSTSELEGSVPRMDWY
uniref:Uncharacterized protein n=1 Tax=Panagrolaimus davidi TaxID=227884 RepID=A0A914QIH6_9BILA